MCSLVLTLRYAFSLFLTRLGNFCFFYYNQITHPSNKKLRAVEAFPLFPDFEIWPTHFTHVAYDANPNDNAEVSLLLTLYQNQLQEIQSRESIVKSISGNYVGYYVPTEPTIEKLFAQRQDPDNILPEEVFLSSVLHPGVHCFNDQTTLEYSHLRDFNLENKFSDRPNASLFLQIKPDVGACFYRNMDGGRVLLRRTRTVKHSSGERGSARVLQVVKRAFTDDEELERAQKRTRIAPLDE